MWYTLAFQCISGFRKQEVRTVKALAFDFTKTARGWNYFHLLCLACAYTDIVVTASLQLLATELMWVGMRMGLRMWLTQVQVATSSYSQVKGTNLDHFWGLIPDPKSLKSDTFLPIEPMVQRYFRYCDEPSKKTMRQVGRVQSVGQSRFARANSSLLLSKIGA